MKNKLFKGILLSILIIFVSCTKNLELTPVSSITNASFWQTEDDANAGITAAYVYLRYQAEMNLFIWGEARSEVMAYPNNGGGTNGYEYYYDNLINPEAAGPNWKGLYSTINAANLIITKVPAIEMNEASKNNILAQAYTMRAYLYFVAARTWGGVPLRQLPTEGYSPESNEVGRSSIEEVFQLIKDDINKATTFFGNDNTFPIGRNRWNRAAAYALKADVYLWTAKRLNGGDTDFTTAIDACNEVGKADVSLLPNFSDLFEYQNKGNEEVIMAIGFKEMEPSSGSMVFTNMYSGARANTVDPINGEIMGVSGGGVVWTVSDLVKNQFTSDDKRKDASFVDIPSETTVIRKGRGVRINGVRYYSSDYVIYRYADVLLMKAEAKNALGQDPSAEIEAVRLRAYGEAYDDHIFVNGTQQQNADTILQERLFELAFEGKRWWDLVRFDKAFEIVPSLEDKADHYLLWPLSVNAVLSLEPWVEQTPGWDISGQ